MRSMMSCSVSFSIMRSSPGPRQAKHNPVCNTRRHQITNVPPAFVHLFDECGGNEEMLLRAHEIDDIHIRVEVPVRPGELYLIIKVRHGPQSAQHDVGTHALHKMNDQVLKAFHHDIRNMPRCTADHVDALVERPDWSLIRYGSHANNEVVAQARSTLNDVNMSSGDRIKCARIDDCIHMSHRPHLQV